MALLGDDQGGHLRDTAPLEPRVARARGEPDDEGLLARFPAR